MSRQVIIAALVLMMVVPLASAAGLLGVCPRIFTSCPWGQTENPVVFSDCAREAKIQIAIINSHETTVVEGSTDLPSSLEVTIKYRRDGNL